jgi:hypothetical protein
MRGRGRPFQEGQSGNPSGRPKVDQTIMELARAHCPEAITTLVRIHARPEGSARRTRTRL